MTINRRSLADIMQEFARAHDVEIGALKHPGNDLNAAAARYDFVHAAHRLVGYSVDEIARAIGGKYAHKKVSDLLVARPISVSEPVKNPPPRTSVHSRSSHESTVSRMTPAEIEAMFLHDMMYE